MSASEKSGNAREDEWKGDSELCRQRTQYSVLSRPFGRAQNYIVSTYADKELHTVSTRNKHESKVDGCFPQLALGTCAELRWPECGYDGKKATELGNINMVLSGCKKWGMY